jgi:TIR domain
MAQVIISYRRADSAAITGRIRDRLVSTYSASRVFMDVEDIPFGGDFRDHIRHALLRSDLLLVIVGREWLGKVDNGARIQSETDPVRIEVETALQNSIPVIPVLVNGAQIPEPTDLPESLKAFAFLNAATVDAGRDFHAHMDRLIVAINAVVAARRKVAPAHLVGGGPEASRFRVGGWSLATAGFAALLLAAAGWWFFNAPLAATQRTAASAEEKAVAATQPLPAPSQPGPPPAQSRPSNPATPPAGAQTVPERPAPAAPSTVAGTYLAEAKAGCGAQRQSVKVAIRDGRISWEHDALDTEFHWEGTITADGAIKAAVPDRPNLQATGRYRLDGREIAMTYPQCVVTMLIGQMLSR